MKTKTICMLLVCAILFSLAGCASVKPDTAEKTETSGKTENKDLMQTITPVQKEKEPIKPEAVTAASDFGLRLLQAANDPGHNTLISPLSVLSALAMTANGAENATLLEMENTLGMRRDQYNDFFYSYKSSIRFSNSLKLANSIWFTDRNGFVPNEDFLTVNATCFGADAYLAPFDNSTVERINGWVKDNTDGMIPSILNEIPDEAEMYLVNALAFDAEWSQPYEKYDVQPREFTAEDGTKQRVEFMWSEEGTYLSDDNATGFIKLYEDRKYAFVALLPNEGTSVEAYLDSLDGKKLQDMFANSSFESVVAATPKFETETDLVLNESLEAMGMRLPFDRKKADFSSLGTSPNGKIYISRVLHKTFMAVDEEGTRAGAATSVEMAAGAAADEEPPKYVILDRPFVYMLIDCETNLPFFIGTMMNPAEQ